MAKNRLGVLVGRFDANILDISEKRDIESAVYLKRNVFLFFGIGIIPRGFGELGFFKTGAPFLNFLKARAPAGRQAFRKFKVGDADVRKNQFLTRERYNRA